MNKQHFIFVSLLSLAVFLLGWGQAARASDPDARTTLRALHALTNAEASQGLPVAFEATVTYYNPHDSDLFVQDGSLAIYVETQPGGSWLPGDRVLVRGTTRASYRTNVLSTSVTLLHHGNLPPAVPANFLQLIHGQRDCQRVTVRGVVRSADIVQYSYTPSTYLQLLMDGGYIDVTAASNDAQLLSQFLDAEVEISGSVSGEFDSKNQLTGIILEVPSLAKIRILKHAPATPRSLPVTPMDRVLDGYNVLDRNSRVRVQGSITYYHAGSAAVLQSGDKSLWITTHTEKPLRVGDLASASGFPDVSSGLLALTRGEIEDSHLAAPIEPRVVTGLDLASGKYAYDLVTIQGRVLAAMKEAAQDEYVLAADGHLFSVIYRHPDIPGSTYPSPMKPIPTGAIARVTGICMTHYGSNPFRGPVSVDLLLRGADDITIAANPSWLSVRHLIPLIVLLLVVVAGIGAWGWKLERRMRHQTAATAARAEADVVMEQRRNRILVEINKTAPLESILREIVELVSFRLQGAPCWCESVDGTLAGVPPSEESTGLRILREQIVARSGAQLGVIFATLGVKVRPSAQHTETLSMGARLAALAIETRRMNDDLLHRSEFDLLTDIHNRFYLEKHLEARIEEARQNSSIFGLIYIDLDEFKLVNDICGHRIGDLYLREAALRMKRQLRSQDLLARLGGDEFAVLVPAVRSRADVEEIAQRLEHCFDDPMNLEERTMQGTASLGIALYPEDGATVDELLCAADVAMYQAKHGKKSAGHAESEEDYSA
jgi:diguanylate cyclase (GGDEF)-like protein